MKFMDYTKDYLMKGIDVSQYQINVDYNKVKSAGYEFVIIRDGFGKLVSQKDKEFENHYRRAIASGMHVGVYHYSYATSVEDAIQEAEVCNTIIKGKKFDFPIWYDIEEQKQFNLPKDTLDNIIKAFCNRMEELGYFVGVYGGQNLADNFMSDYTKNKYCFWLAQYLKPICYKGRIDQWQFSIAGDKPNNNPYNVQPVPGVNGLCDVDYCYVDYPTAIKTKKLNGYQDEDTQNVTPKEPEQNNTFTFVPRFTIPEKGNKYYNTKSNGGYSTAIVGKPTQNGLNVLSNCVGYAFGRYNEIIGENNCNYLLPVNAENFVDVAMQQGLKISNEPSLGSIICWQKGATRDPNKNDGAGHVAVVEQINSDGSIITSESGYNCSNPFWTTKRSRGNGNWGQNSSYTFLGFIENPKVNNSKPKENRAPYPVPTNSVTEGMNNSDDVRWLQWYLTDLKYFNDPIDGCFGIFTLGALLAFQKKSGLECDGICGPLTRSRLINA
jgi:surface antigen